MNPTKEEIIDKAKHAVMNLDEIAVEKIAQQALEAGVSPVELIELGFVEGMKAVGDLFEEGKSQLAEIFEASHIVESGIDVLRPAIMGSKNDVCLFGNLVVGM
ncbi:cobalamin B12-binding domain-containing protein [Methanolobus bombayensis]|uniref:cobalamin B12-binding domain-containing protein n=1 Tax=Methanolobus bombayensis TaxID=38023 RepID=UPI001AEA9197|nr:B12-binding domain-containing protein [Methanolobus bombayensis]MBP1910210.1 methanogenic corrinoid protein MtbC1 [Methanolobus bombayensis]